MHMQDIHICMHIHIHIHICIHQDDDDPDFDAAEAEEPQGEAPPQLTEEAEIYMEIYGDI